MSRKKNSRVPVENIRHEVTRTETLEEVRNMIRFWAKTYNNKQYGQELLTMLDQLEGEAYKRGLK